MTHERPTAAAVPLLDLRHVDVMRGERLALSDVTLRVLQGEHVAILGPNGCGKSTFIKLLTRELYPLAKPGSDIRILGRRLWNVNHLRTTLGIISNDLRTQLDPSATAFEAVASGAFARHSLMPQDRLDDAVRAAAGAALTTLGLAHLAQRRFDQLSLGESQRVMIARAFINDPNTFVFDEPCSALDVGAQMHVRDAMRTLARRGAGLLLVTHDFDDIVPEIERVVFLSDGRIVGDGARGAMLRADALARLFGVDPCHFRSVT
ncbi:MAG: ABC transporter ATP-binding protein [Candidatus Velthaea sp.]